MKALRAKNDNGASAEEQVIVIDGRASRELMREIAIGSLRGAVAFLKSKLEAAAGVEVAAKPPLAATDSDKEVMTADLYIGRRVQGVFATNGAIDELKWWTVARTEQEMCGDGQGTWQNNACSIQ